MIKRLSICDVYNVKNYVDIQETTKIYPYLITQYMNFCRVKILYILQINKVPYKG